LEVAVWSKQLDMVNNAISPSIVFIGNWPIEAVK